MDLIEWQGKSRVEEGLREVGKRIGKNNMKTLSESFAYKEEQRHGLMVDRKCGVKGRLFFFSKKEKDVVHKTRDWLLRGIWLCTWGSFVGLGETSEDVEWWHCQV